MSSGITKVPSAVPGRSKHPGAFEVLESQAGEERLRGVLVGTALGDSVGLPAEGLSRQKIAQLGWGKPWRQRFFFGRGMCSDDTEHTVMVLQSLLEAAGDVELFRKRFARRLRWWLLGLPAGVGLATARAALKLWCGIRPERSGVSSAGNGPAMRSAIIGAFYPDDAEMCAAFVRASTVVTHTDPKALIGALAVAELAAGPCAEAEVVLPVLRELGNGDREWLGLVDQMEELLSAGTDVGGFAVAIGCGDGVGGYVYETVPVAIYSWLFHRGEGGAAVAAALDCGGDADTVGAITGALCGASPGRGFISAGMDFRLVRLAAGDRFSEQTGAAARSGVADILGLAVAAQSGVPRGSPGAWAVAVSAGGTAPAGSPAKLTQSKNR